MYMVIFIFWVSEPLKHYIEPQIIIIIRKLITVEPMSMECGSAKCIV